MKRIRESTFLQRVVIKPSQILFISVLVISTIRAESPLPLNEEKIITSLKKSYGERAGKRGKAWFQLMKEKSKISELDSLKKVNKFFNLFRFIDDKTLWGKSNYWATPIEFIGVNGGDCEDYSIAKYFTLLELGIADEKMRITMVKAVQLNQYHMVLAYYETPSSMPLILDNIDGVIKPANQRNDLIPIYSFNASQLWLNKEKGRGVLSGKSSKLKLWRDLRQRITTSKLKQPKLNMEF
jgi:predicted transglutaminase-like cysteine proteinase